MRDQAVRAAGAVEEHCLLRAAAARRGLERIARLVRERRGIEIVSLRRAHPAALRQHDGDGLARDQLGLVDRLRGGALDDAAAAVVAELLRIGEQLFAHQLLQPRLALAAILSSSSCSVSSSFCSPRIFISSSFARWRSLVSRIASAWISRQLEALHQHRLRLVLAADDADDLVEVQVDREQAVEDVQPRAAPSRGAS